MPGAPRPQVYMYIYIQAARPQGRKRLAQIYKKESRPQAALFFEKHEGRKAASVLNHRLHATKKSVLSQIF
jgi:hypothetical protein